MKVTWSRRWAILWLIWLAVSGLSFLALEIVGLNCEWLGIAGCSTLSAWMVSNWGVVFMVVATLAVAAVAVAHWVQVSWLQKR